MLENLKKLRTEYGVSQARLAEAIGVSQQAINTYENHNIEPDIAGLSLIADFFDTSIDYLVGRTEIRRKIEPVQPFDLNAEETRIVEGCRALGARERKYVAALVELLAEK